MPDALGSRKIGCLRERDWGWQGWQIRYGFARSPQVDPDAAPILLIHGFGSSLQQWSRNIESLSRVHPVYVLDLLGFGSSEKAATTYNVDSWARQIHQFWRQFLQRPMIIVGHSLGALVAATVATSYPEAIQKVVLMTLPATRQEIVSSPLARQILGRIEQVAILPPTVRAIFAIARQPSLIRRVLKQIYTNSDQVTDELVEQFVAPTRDRGAAQTLCRLTQSATDTDYSQSRTTLLTKLSQPTLMLWGERDRIVPFQQGVELHRQFPHLTWHPVPNAGHCLYDERADYVNQTMLSWMGDRSLLNR